MKKIWRKLYRRELLPDFVMSGLIVLLWGGFFLTQIKRIARTAPAAGDVEALGLSAVMLLATIALLGVFVYKRSMSYIRWYQGVLDSIPIPVIVTGEDARWQYVNEKSREIMDIGRDDPLEKRNSGHLIDADGAVIKKTWIHRGTEYRTAGNRLRVNGKDGGYLLLLYNVSDMPDSREARAMLPAEIDKFLSLLETAAEYFRDCASSFAGTSARQEGIIVGLSEVIAEIASGALGRPDALIEKINTVKADMQKHVEITQAQLERIKRTVEEMDAACDSIDNALRSIHNIP